MYYSSQYPYTMYSLQQCVCQSPKSAINEQVAQMNMNTRLQMMQMEQCIQNQIPHISFGVTHLLECGTLADIHIQVQWAERLGPLEAEARGLV